MSDPIDWYSFSGWQRAVNTTAPPSHADALYCLGCNERFQRAEDSAACPRCGATMAAASAADLADTLLLKDPSECRTHVPLEEPESERELDSLIGRRLHVYQIDSLLGCGGMGRVYLAHHTDLHRRCALKVLSPRAVAADVDYVSRFYHEGRAAAALIHPNIITTHAIGRDQGYHFLEMELITGPSLQQLIEDEGRLTPVRSTALIAQLAEGLAAAHQEKIVHRDLKPDNILLTQRGIPKIADFGLAKRVFWRDGLPAGHLAGTPNFMAPELFQGEPASPASDIYALGVSYYLLLTGRFPFTGGSLGELMRAILNDPLPNPRRDCPDIPLEMAECLSLLMAKSPANRPRDGIEAAQLLRAVLGHVRDAESLLREAFLDEPCVSWIRCGQRYRLRVELPDGRRQTLFVEPSEHGAADRLLLIYSVCCRAQPEFYEYALRLNAEIAHGGLSLREIDDELHFCMVDTYPRSTVDPEEIRRSVLEVALQADGIEKLLTGDDCH